MILSIGIIKHGSISKHKSEMKSEFGFEVFEVWVFCVWLKFWLRLWLRLVISVVVVPPLEHKFRRACSYNWGYSSKIIEENLLKSIKMAEETRKISTHCKLQKKIKRLLMH